MKQLVTEFIGTLFLVLTIVLAATAGPDVSLIAIGLMLTAMVYMGGHVSGAHYNPAVSTAVLLAGKMKAKDFPGYVLAQLLGGLVGGFAGQLMAAKGVPIGPGMGVSMGVALGCEVAFTFALALTVLNVACSAKTTGNSYFGLAIGLVVVAGVFAGGRVSGGAFNPAVGIGVTASGTPDGASWSNIWLYIVGPLIGAVLAAGAFRLQEEATTS